MEKKRNIVEWAMHYRQIVILITCCLIAFGVYGLDKMNKNEFPDFTIRQGVVLAVYPGATAEDVEEQVTKPLENYIFSYKEVKKAKTKSYSRNGVSIIQVELNDDVTDKDAFWSKFKHGVSSFKSSLPQGVLALQVNDDFGDTSSLLITLESKDKTYRELNDYMNSLKDSLRQIESVGRLNVYGMQKEQICVYLDNDRLSHYGINDKTIAVSLLNKGFVTIASLKDGSYNSPVYVQRSMNMVRDVENMIVYSDVRGNNVRLGDVARVVREYPAPNAYVTNNGVKCLVLSAEIKKGRSITEMGASIDKKLEGFKQTLPNDVSTFKITDQAKVVNDSVIDFLSELLIAIVAVVIVVMLLMPMRVALVAASTIPITIFISLGLFYAFGIELNTVTLAALIVTLGMIVDNSIVIIDSYVEMLAQGYSRWNASIKSATHFFKSILTATLAISVTFFPFLITMTGMSHDFLLLFPWSISIVLFVSLLVAELVVPFLQFYFIKKPMEVVKDGENGQNKKFSFLDVLQRVYDKLIDRCFAHPYITVGVGVLSVVIGVWMLGLLPQQLMPTAERNQFAVEIYLPTGSSMEKTVQIADSVKSVLKQDDRVVSIASFNGMSSPRFHASYAPQFAGTNYAQFIVNTKDDKATVEVLEKYGPEYEAAFPGAYVRFKQLTYSDAVNPVEVRLTGDDWKQLKSVADSLTGVLRKNPELRLVRNDLNEQLVTTCVKLDEDKAARLGISNSTAEIAMAMRYNSDGLPVGTVWNGDYDVSVKLKGNHADHSTRQNVADEMIPVFGGISNVPLRQVATVTPEWQDGQIPHRNGIRTITILSDVAQGVNITAASEKIQKQLGKVHLPNGVNLTYGGELEGNAECMPQILSALMVAVAIIFFLLLGHFRRISTALLLLFSLLLCVFGTAAGILIQGVNMSLTCFLGIISLMGILVRNAIIMYDYAEELRTNEKMTAHEAIYTSAKRRLRPIFLTSAAASMGVIPMIIGGSGLWMPMGAVICYGTLITMIFILTILPVGYWLVMSGTSRKREKSNKLELR